MLIYVSEEPLYIENDVCVSKYLIDGKFII